MKKRSSRIITLLMICSLLCGCRSQDVATSQTESAPAAAPAEMTTSADNSEPSADISVSESDTAIVPVTEETTSLAAESAPESTEPTEQRSIGSLIASLFGTETAAESEELPNGVWVDEHGFVLNVKDGTPIIYNGSLDKMPILLDDRSVSIDGMTAVPADSEKGKEYIHALQKAAEGEWVFYYDEMVFTFKDGVMTLGNAEESMDLAEYKWNGCEMILKAYDTESPAFIRVENDTLTMISEGYPMQLFRKGSEALAQYIRENGEDPAQLIGKWYNGDDFSEEWLITENYITIDGKRCDYTAAPQLEYIELTIDGKKYTVFINEFNDSIALSGDEYIILYSENSGAYKDYHQKQKIKEQCGELLSRYPDNSGWLESRNYGDIPLLADVDYLDEYAATGYFPVSTPEQLASVCYYINTHTADFIMIEITADIDLSGKQWAPMGWGNENPFNAVVVGNGHTISGLTINSDDADVGFIGWATYCGVSDLSFVNADINGGSAVGVVTGQSIGGAYRNVSASGKVTGSRAGSLLGYDANSTITDCIADVTVNGEKFEFLSWNEKEKSEIVIENPVTITMDEDHTVHRPEVEGYHNLGWMVFLDGVQMLHRNAENEYSYRYFLNDPGTYEIYLTAYVKGQYVPISNTVTYTIN